MKWMTLETLDMLQTIMIIKDAHNSGIMWVARPSKNGFVVEVEDNEFSRKVFCTYFYKPFLKN